MDFFVKGDGEEPVQQGGGPMAVRAAGRSLLRAGGWRRAPGGKAGHWEP